MIDVRGPDEFRGPLGHITGALNLPLGELSGRLTDIKALKDKSIILVCRTDKRSANAAASLRDAGFRDVRVLREARNSGTQKRPRERKVGPGCGGEAVAHEGASK